MKIIGYIQVPHYRFSTSSRISLQLATDDRYLMLYVDIYIMKRKKEKRKRYIDIFRRGHK